MITIAIIGSRRMTFYGKKVVGWFLGKLEGREITVITGDVSGVNREVASEARRRKIDLRVVSATLGMEKMNYMMAKMADILVIIEGGKNSGTILVAKNFLDLNKEVWAVPGNIFEQNCWATNWLISQGARLIGQDDLL